MPSPRTEITEIVTGLGMTGLQDIERALAQRPEQLRNVSSQHWQRLSESFASGDYAVDFSNSWTNGEQFLRARSGLRDRTPVLIEWKGHHRPPGFDFLPADLRVDHVFLVSCKYLSRILANSSPTNLFERRLADRSTGREPDWFEACAPAAYREFYADLRTILAGVTPLPPSHDELTADEIAAIRLHTGGSWPRGIRSSWKQFSYAVAAESAARWRATLATAARREEMLWRLLRLGPAPYFVLGSSPDGPIRLRIATPWDWLQDFKMYDFEVWAENAGQPIVGWRAIVQNRASEQLEIVEGHVEIRWSHGRFSAVEAKVYLDTPHENVPGYYSLA